VGVECLRGEPRSTVCERSARRPMFLPTTSDSSDTLVIRVEGLGFGVEGWRSMFLPTTSDSSDTLVFRVEGLGFGV
jgi:hypothetical protein